MRNSTNKIFFKYGVVAAVVDPVEGIVVVL